MMNQFYREKEHLILCGFQDTPGSRKMK
jgi:hypothetical protein